MLYIHIPFCKHRCIYCDFYSTTQSLQFIHEYLDAVKSEISQRAHELPSRKLSSVYIGGGTPSLMPTNAIKNLFASIQEQFIIDKEAEVTFEANPEDVSIDLLNTLYSLGVNRISLGVQSFDNSQLTLLNRRHSAKKVIEAVTMIHHCGFKHISIDLIYGQPGQTIEKWVNDLNQAFALPIDHLSAYTLSIEDNTLLKRKLDAGELTLPSDEEVWEQYKVLCEQAKRYGFEHYEISNFSLPGCASRHNCGYWTNRPYLGIGPGAHSYNTTYRSSNPSNLLDYIANKGIVDRNIEELSQDEKCNEYVFTSLRTSSGLHLPTLELMFGNSVATQIYTWAKPHITKGNLLFKENTLQLTEEGFFVSNDVMSDLMYI